MEKHYAKVYGDVLRKVYRFNKNGEGEVYVDFVTMESRIIWEGELELPQLEIGEWIYIKDINQNTQVNSKIRDLEGGFRYYTDYIIEIVNNEITEKMKVKAEEARIKHKEQLEKKSALSPSTINKKRYQFWK